MTGHWYSSGGIGLLGIMSLLTNVRVDCVDLQVSGGRHWSAVTDDSILVIQHWSYNIGNLTPFVFRSGHLYSLGGICQLRFICLLTNARLYWSAGIGRSTLVGCHWWFDIGHLTTAYLKTGHLYSSGGNSQLKILCVLTNARFWWPDGIGQSTVVGCNWWLNISQGWEIG